jgi:hypothetical protein
MIHILLQVLVISTLAAGCASTHEHNVSIETVAEPQTPLAPTSAIVVDKSLPDPFILPYSSSPDVGSRSSTLEKAKLRGKQGMEIGAIPGAFLNGGNLTAKGDVLAIALLLAGVSAGGIAGSAVGIVEGGTQDLIAIAARLQDGYYTTDDVQEVYRALNTRELLAKDLSELSGRGSKNPVVVLSEVNLAAAADSTQSETRGVLRVKVTQIDFLSHTLGSDAARSFVLVVRAESENTIGQGVLIKQFTFRSKERTLSEWADGGAALLRSEHSRGCREIAESIIAHFVSSNKS